MNNTISNESTDCNNSNENFVTLKEYKNYINIVSY